MTEIAALKELALYFGVVFMFGLLWAIGRWVRTVRRGHGDSNEQTSLHVDIRPPYRAEDVSPLEKGRVAYLSRGGSRPRSPLNPPPPLFVFNERGIVTYEELLAATVTPTHLPESLGKPFEVIQVELKP